MYFETIAVLPTPSGHGKFHYSELLIHSSPLSTQRAQVVLKRKRHSAHYYDVLVHDCLDSPSPYTRLFQDLLSTISSSSRRLYDKPAFSLAITIVPARIGRVIDLGTVGAGRTKGRLKATRSLADRYGFSLAHTPPVISPAFVANGGTHVSLFQKSKWSHYH
jgi:hypothetical protein